MRARDSRLNLSPWVRAVAGPPGPEFRVPYGYFISGLAKTGAGPWTLELYRDGDGLLASSSTSVASDVRPRLLSLIDIAAIDAAERANQRVTVTVDGAGFIREIADA